MVYNMPPRGLGAAGTLAPVEAESARDRIVRADDDDTGTK